MHGKTQINNYMSSMRHTEHIFLWTTSSVEATRRQAYVREMAALRQNFRNVKKRKNWNE
jgi:hypothetical protein